MWETGRGANAERVITAAIDDAAAAGADFVRLKVKAAVILGVNTTNVDGSTKSGHSRGCGRARA